MRVLSNTATKLANKIRRWCPDNSPAPLLKRSLLRTASFILAPLIASPALAAAEAGAKSKGDGGLPQLDIGSYPGQVFWLFVFFIALYLLFSKYLLPLISSTIQNRAAHIQDDQETASRLTREAEEAHQLYEDKLQEARNEASRIYKDIEQDVSEITQSRWSEFREKVMEQEAEIQKGIDKTRQEALEEMNTIAAEIAQLAAQKITGANMDITAAKNAVSSLNTKGRAA